MMISMWFWASVVYVAFVLFCIRFDFILAKNCVLARASLGQKPREEDLKARLVYAKENLKLTLLFSLQHTVLLCLPLLSARLIAQYYEAPAVFIYTALLSVLVIIPCAVISWGHAFFVSNEAAS